MKPYYKDESATLYLEDSFEALKGIEKESIDVIFADPPYFLSNNGITCKSGRMESVNKGSWDQGFSFDEKHLFNRKWINMCRRALKPNGTIWITGTLHNIYSIGVALEQEGFKIINNITWQKTNPPPNLACRCFTHSTETILWAKKNDNNTKHYFNYLLMKEMNNDKQMKDVWIGASAKKKEKEFGKHPTQKPEYLLNIILLASTRESELVLDPFCGSGTTGVVAKRLNRRFIGIDNNQEYIEIAKKRMESITDE